MEHLYERISYLMGLAEGLGIEEGSKEGKLLLHILDTLEDFADAINEINEDQEDLIEYVDYMDEDLADVEEELFGEFDEDYDDFDEDFDYDDDDIEYVELECPHCHEIVYIEADLLDEDTCCPNCLEKIVTGCCCGNHEEVDK